MTKNIEGFPKILHLQKIKLELDIFQQISENTQ